MLMSNALTGGRACPRLGLEVIADEQRGLIDDTLAAKRDLRELEVALKCGMKRGGKPPKDSEIREIEADHHQHSQMDIQPGFWAKPPLSSS